MDFRQELKQKISELFPRLSQESLVWSNKDKAFIWDLTPPTEYGVRLSLGSAQKGRQFWLGENGLLLRSPQVRFANEAILNGVDWDNLELEPPVRGKVRVRVRGHPFHPLVPEEAEAVLGYSIGVMDMTITLLYPVLSTQVFIPLGSFSTVRSKWVHKKFV